MLIVMALSCRKMLDSVMVIGLSRGKLDVADVPADDGTIVGSTDAWAAVCAVVDG